MRRLERGPLTIGIPCQTCNGTGKVIKHPCKSVSQAVSDGRTETTTHPASQTRVDRICVCVSMWCVCRTCKGSGTVLESKTFTLDIPAGVKSGMEMRIPNAVRSKEVSVSMCV